MPKYRAERGHIYGEVNSIKGHSRTEPHRFVREWIASRHANS